MDYAVKFEHVRSGEEVECRMDKYPCFGRLSYSPSNYHTFRDAGVTREFFISEIAYIIPNRHFKVVKEIVKTLRMPEMSVVHPEDYSLLKPNEIAVLVKCSDLDRGDVMRNLFVIRNVCDYGAEVAKYKSLRKECTPRQALALLNVCTPVKGIGGSFNGKVVASSRYSSFMFNPINTKLSDIRRFLRNPQDARGQRQGTFREHPGEGYTTGTNGHAVVSSFVSKPSDYTRDGHLVNSKLFKMIDSDLHLSDEISKVLNFGK